MTTTKQQREQTFRQAHGLISLSDGEQQLQMTVAEFCAFEPEYDPAVAVREWRSDGVCFRSDGKTQTGDDLDAAPYLRRLTSYQRRLRAKQYQPESIITPPPQGRLDEAYWTQRIAADDLR